MKSMLIAVAAFVLSSSAIYTPVPPDPPAHSVPEHLDEPLTIYEMAARITGAPADILRGIAYAESGEDDAAIGDQGRSLGRFQINETFRAERIRLYGLYDPHDPIQSAIIAGRIYVDNLARLGDEDLAIAAHMQGVMGVRLNGAARWYIERVRKHGR